MNGKIKKDIEMKTYLRAAIATLIVTRVTYPALKAYSITEQGYTIVANQFTGAELLLVAGVFAAVLIVVEGWQKTRLHKHRKNKPRVRRYKLLVTNGVLSGSGRRTSHVR